MLMRVAIGIHGEDIEAAIETYNLMSEKLFTHASPTMFNAATPRPQLSRFDLLLLLSGVGYGPWSTFCGILVKQTVSSYFIAVPVLKIK